MGFSHGASQLHAIPWRGAVGIDTDRILLTEGWRLLHLECPGYHDVGTSKLEDAYHVLSESQQVYKVHGPGSARRQDFVGRVDEAIYLACS